jgi:TolB-like protein
LFFLELRRPYQWIGEHQETQYWHDFCAAPTKLEGMAASAPTACAAGARLINSADGYHVWSERYDREMKDVFAIQDEIARSIAQRLQVSFEGGKS